MYVCMHSIPFCGDTSVYLPILLFMSIWAVILLLHSAILSVFIHVFKYTFTGFSRVYA